MIKNATVSQLAVLHANLPLSKQREIERELQERGITDSVGDLVNEQNDREQKFADCMKIIIGERVTISNFGKFLCWFGPVVVDEKVVIIDNVSKF